jgi:hypothetical protein
MQERELFSFVCHHLILIQQHFILFVQFMLFLSFLLVKILIHFLVVIVLFLLFYKINLKYFNQSSQKVKNKEYLINQLFFCLLLLRLTYNPNQFCSQLKMQTHRLIYFHYKDLTMIKHYLMTICL